MIFYYLVNKYTVCPTKIQPVFLDKSFNYENEFLLWFTLLQIYFLFFHTTPKLSLQAYWWQSTDNKNMTFLEISAIVWMCKWANSHLPIATMHWSGANAKGHGIFRLCVRYQMKEEKLKFSMTDRYLKNEFSLWNDISKKMGFRFSVDTGYGACLCDVMLSLQHGCFYSIGNQYSFICKPLFTLLCVMVSPWTSPFVVQAHDDRVHVTALDI